MGSKSKLDKRRGPNTKGSNSGPTRESTPSTGSELRVGEKRSSEKEKRSSEKDEDEVCSPAKKPRRARVDSELDMDSVMEESVSTDTVEEASREGPHVTK